MEPDTGSEEYDGDQEFEVEDILKYRRDDDGEEYFLVLWAGCPVEESTWEPLENLNEDCQELVAKARALFAFRRQLAAAAPTIEEDEMSDEEEEDLVEIGVAPATDIGFGWSRCRVNGGDIDVDGAIGANAGFADTAPGEKRCASQAPDAAIVSAPTKRRRLSQRAGDHSDSTSEATRAVAGGGAVDGGAHLTKEAAAQQPRSPPGEAVAAKPKGLRCICGSSDKHPPAGDFVVCNLCGFSLHASCVRSALGGPVPADYVCPHCRLERVDEFHPPVGPGLLQHSVVSSTSTITLKFSAQVAHWRKQQWAVHLRAVPLNSAHLSGPGWPHRVQGKLNGRECVAIEPPKHLHIRRDQCYNLTPLIKPGTNVLEMKFTNKPDGPEQMYAVGVVLTRPRSVASVIARVRNRSSATVSSGKDRVLRLLQQVAENEAHQDECKVTGNFGRVLKPVCPVSHCPIEEAAIGKSCTHVQVFDLHSYISVNQRMRSLEKRWTCPVCGLALRPDDIVLDPFSQGILDTLRGDEDSVEAVVFNEDGSWSTVSAAKDDKEGDGQDDEAMAATSSGGAAMIDLSDSE